MTFTVQTRKYKKCVKICSLVFCRKNKMSKASYTPGRLSHALIADIFVFTQSIFTDNELSEHANSLPDIRWCLMKTRNASVHIKSLQLLAITTPSYRDFCSRCRICNKALCVQTPMRPAWCIKPKKRALGIFIFKLHFFLRVSVHTHIGTLCLVTRC